MFAGIDIGGTNIKGAILDRSGELSHFTSIPTNAQEGQDAVVDRVVHLISDLRSTCTVDAIGIGFPSVVQPATGLVYPPPNMPGWEILPLREIVLQRTGLPVFVDNDANVAAIAEHTFGIAKCIHDFLYVTLGTGVGGAIVTNGTLFHGERGGAGEIGHLIVNINDVVTPEMLSSGREFRCGVLEEYCGRMAILRRAVELGQSAPESRLAKLVQGDFDVEHLSALAAEGDENALSIFTQTGHILGLGVASAFALLDLRTVVVGGGISQAHPVMLQSMSSTLRSRCLPSIAVHTRVLPAHFQSQAGVVGAAALAMNNLDHR